MDFQKFKTFLLEQMFLFCLWDEQRWQDEYVVFKKTIANWNPEFLLKSSQDDIIQTYAKTMFCDSRRDTHPEALKEEYLYQVYFSVFFCFWEEEASQLEPIHELVQAPDKVTAIEKVVLSSYPNHLVREGRKNWFAQLNGSCFEDIQKELIQENIVVFCESVSNQVKEFKLKDNANWHLR